MNETVRRKLGGRRTTTMEKYLLALVSGYIVLVSVKNPLFLSLETLFDLMRTGAGTMILAAGVLVVLVSGGIDVSFTSVAVVSAYTTVNLMLATGIDNILFALVVSMLIGLVLGAVNALLIHFLALPAFVVTLGTGSVYFGLMAMLLGTASFPAAEMPQSFLAFGTTELITVTRETERYGLSISFLIVVAVLAATWFILHRTMLGRSIYAIGCSEESASRVGISILRTKLFVYCYVGLLAGLMGVVYYSELKFINPTSLIGTELMIIAAVVIGGAKFSGGEGTVLGTVLGVLLMLLFQTTLVFLGLSSSWNNFFFGGVLLVSLSVMYYRQRRLDRKNLVFLAV